MRTLVAIAVLVSAVSVAVAKRKRDFDVDYDRPEPCASGKAWSDVQKCLDKNWGRLEILHHTDKTKTLAVVPKGSVKGAGRRVMLYVLRDAGWSRTSMNLYPTETNDILHIGTFATPSGDAIRVDQGFTSRTSFTIQTSPQTPSTTVRGVIRRTMTTVCTPADWGCRSLMTSCETYVRGKVYWAFHADLVWHASLGLRLEGSRMATGGLCKPAESLMVDPEDD